MVVGLISISLALVALVAFVALVALAAFVALAAQLDVPYIEELIIGTVRTDVNGLYKRAKLPSVLGL